MRVWWEIRDSIPKFLTTLYSRVEEGNLDFALDHVFLYVYHRIDHKHWEDLDELLKSINLQKVDHTTLIGIAVSTRGSCDLLKERENYVRRVSRLLGRIIS